MSPLINLKQYSKVKLLHNKSSIQYLNQLSRVLGVELYMKRDDLSEVGCGGNKLRKLEYLLGDAKQRKATHILTLGALQSNHARLTAVSAIKTGFECELFLKKSVDISTESYQENGNLLLERIIGAKIHKIEADNYVQACINTRIEQIKKEGGLPYFIPIGGSNALGTLGYLDCFLEILQQQNELQVKFDHICLASGSGGTHAGLITGKILTKSDVKIQAYNVQPESDGLINETLNTTNQALILSKSKNKITRKEICLNSMYSGTKYGFPEEIHLETIKFLAKYEGIFLDPVYTSKAFTGLLMDIENGIYKKGEKILFIHTGGLPGLFAYQNQF